MRSDICIGCGQCGAACNYEAMEAGSSSDLASVPFPKRFAGSPPGWRRSVDGDKLTDWGMQGAPDLAVEIVSPASGKKDGKQKFSLYEHYGVREYWIVDPDEQVVEIYRHNGKRFGRIGAYGPEDRPGRHALIYRSLQSPRNSGPVPAAVSWPSTSVW